MAADMCVTVTKYSHAIGEKRDGRNNVSIPWIHNEASNMFIVLKGENTYIQNGRLTMQVVQGNTVLVTVNVGELIDKSIEARSGSQRAGITPQIEQLPIFGIHKDIYLAFRYRLADGEVLSRVSNVRSAPTDTSNQARRMQLKLESAHDTASWIDVLKRRGLEFQQKRPRTAKPTTARLGTSEALERPSTVQTSYSASRAFVEPPDPPEPSPIQMPVLEAGGLSSQHSVNAQGSFAFQRPHKQTFLQYAPRPTPFQGPIRSATTHDTDHPMADADLLRSHPDFSQRSIDDAATHHFDTPIQMQMAATSRSTTQFEPPGIASSCTAGGISPYRPSLPPSLRMPETLEHEMPPRRELPFKRPGSYQSSSSRPSTTSKLVCYDATGGSSDRPITSSASSPAKRSDGNRPATAASSKRAVCPKMAQPAQKAQLVSARPQSHASTLPKSLSAKSSAKPQEAGVPQSTFRRPSDLGELLRIVKPLSERSPNSNKVSRTDSTADAAYELDTPPGTSSSPAKRISGYSTSDVTMPNSPLRRVGVEDSTSSSTAGAGTVEAASLASYAAQSREDRQTVLDEFMVSKLEDPNFAVLCEDLDTCWRRIALGL